MTVSITFHQFVVVAPALLACLPACPITVCACLRGVCPPAVADPAQCPYYIRPGTAAVAYIYCMRKQFFPLFYFFIFLYIRSPQKTYFTLLPNVGHHTVRASFFLKIYFTNWYQLSSPSISPYRWATIYWPARDDDQMVQCPNL